MISISEEKGAWVSFDGRTKQKASELSPELREKLGIVLDDEINEVKEKPKKSKIKSDVRNEEHKEEKVEVWITTRYESFPEFIERRIKELLGIL